MEVQSLITIRGCVDLMHIVAPNRGIGGREPRIRIGLDGTPWQVMVFAKSTHFGPSTLSRNDRFPARISQPR